MSPAARASLRLHAGPVALLCLVALACVGRLVLLGELPCDAGPGGQPARASRPIGLALAALHPATGREWLDRRGLWQAHTVTSARGLTAFGDHAAVHRQVRAGHLPLWQPLGQAGLPLAVGRATGPFVPLSAPGLLPPAAQGWGLVLLLHLVLAGVGLYAFLVSRGDPRLAALAGALVFQLGPFSVDQLYRADVLPAFALVPLVLVALARIPGAASPWRPAAVVAALTALQWLSARPEACVVALGTQALLGLPLLGAPGTRGREAFWFVAATFLGVLGASLRLLPLAELASHAALPGARLAETNALPAGALLTVPFPRFLGHPAHGDYVGGLLFDRPFWSLHGPGPGTLATALAAVGAWTRRRRAPLVLVAGSLGTLLALSRPALHEDLAALLPAFDTLDWTLLLGATQLGAALLAADGAAQLGARAPVRAATLVPLALGATALALDLGARLAGPGRFWLHVRHLARPTLLAAPRVLVPVLLAAALAMLFRACARREARWARPGLCAALALELLVLARPGLPSAPAGLVLRETAAVRALRAASAGQPPPRVLGLASPDPLALDAGDPLPADLAALLDLDDLRAGAGELSSRVGEVLATGGVPGSLPLAWIDTPLLDLLDVGYVLSARALPARHFRPVAPGLWANTHPHARAFLVRCAGFFWDADLRVRLLRSPDFRAFDQAMLESFRDDAPWCTRDRAPEPVAVRYPSPDRATLQVTARAPGVLVLADAWAPGWVAAVDGVDQAVFPVDHVLRGVLLDPGRHRVEFRYRPGALLDGARLSLAAWLVMLLAAQRRRPLSLRPRFRLR